MKSLSSIAIAIVLAVALFIIGHDDRLRSGAYNNLNWDGYSYYLYLPATFIYGTPFHFDFHRDHFERYAISSSVYQFRGYGEREAPFFTMGVAICELPFFFVAHGLNTAFLGFPKDGLSAPYQFGILAAALFFLGLGLFFLRKIVLPYFGETVTGVTLLALALGTNLLYYSIYDAALSHVYLFGLYALLLSKTQDWHQNPTAKRAAWIGGRVGSRSIRSVRGRGATSAPWRDR